MAYIADRLVSICARSNVTFDISLHEVYVRAGVRYVITKLSRTDSLPNFLTHRAPLRALRAREISAMILRSVYCQQDDQIWQIWLIERWISTELTPKNRFYKAKMKISKKCIPSGSESVYREIFVPHRETWEVCSQFYLSKAVFKNTVRSPRFIPSPRLKYSVRSF